MMKIIFNKGALAILAGCLIALLYREEITAENLKTVVWGIAATLMTAFVIGIALYEGAKKDIFFTFPKENEITFINFGQSLHNMLGRLPERKFDHDGKITDEVGAGSTIETISWKQGWWSWLARVSWEWFRAYPIGIPGLFRVHEFPIVKRRMRQTALTDNNMPFDERWIETEREIFSVRSLRRVFSRPVAARGVELPEDGAQVTFVGDGLFEVTDPKIPVYRLGANFMSIIEQVVSQAIASACKQEYPQVDQLGNWSTYSLSFRTLKAIDIGRDSLFVQTIIGLANKGSGTNPGLQEQCGVKLVGLYIPDFDPDPATKALADAQLKLEEERAKGAALIEQKTKAAEARRQEGHGEGDYQKLVGQGAAAAVQAELQVLLGQGVPPEIAAQILARRQTPNLATLVEAGAVEVKTDNRTATVFNGQP